MKLYFTRHGKTEWNQQGRFQGKTGDSPLLSSSYQEVYQLAQIIKKVPLKKIYTSTSLRAKTTAELIQKELHNPIDIVYTTELKELGLGKLEGQLITEMEKVHPVELKNMRYHLDQYDPTVFQGESIEEAVNRVIKLIKQAQRIENGPCLFVGHGVSMTAAIQCLVGKTSNQWRTMGGLKNNSLTVVSTDGMNDDSSYKLEVWNDDSFLRTVK